MTKRPIGVFDSGSAARVLRAVRASLAKTCCMLPIQIRALRRRSEDFILNR